MSISDHIATMHTNTRKLSVVLPLTLSELRAPITAPRQSVGMRQLSVLRTRFLLLSWLTNFRQEDVLDFLIVCPAAQVSSISALLASATCNPRYRVIAEESLCLNTDIEFTSDTRRMLGDNWRGTGWFIQQLIKLSIAEHIRSEYYLTLDSDIVCVKSCSYDSVIRSGLAATNVETVEDYNRLYKAAFVVHESLIKVQRYENSGQLIGYKRPTRLLRRFYGETPVVLHTDSVIALKEHLTKRFGRPWCQALAGNSGWTEYGLYFQFLEMTGELDSVCRLMGCNTVLDLEKSVWQKSEHYRDTRLYDAAHFSLNIADANGGFFVAIQSWLNPLSWLPPRYRSVGEFYADIGRWLFHDRYARENILRGRDESLGTGRNEGGCADEASEL
jgi:hypothetical protein